MDTSNNNIWTDYLGKKFLLVAMSLALITHGVIIYFTLPKTYDAYVHIFFADHYSRFWFEPWEYRWYTGFLTISYPPLVHQMIALISKIFPLKVSFCIYAITILQILIVGVYRFSKLFFDKATAGIAALLVVLLSSIVETLHVFGQMPTLTGLAFLLNALPFLYQYLCKGKTIYLVMALSFFAVVISSHHVTAIFGVAFFVAPTVFMALSDGLNESQEKKNLFKYLYTILVAAIKKYKKLFIFGALMIPLAVGLIFPYWYWSKTDPITQVSIPHGSRDNFFLKPSSGIVFYIIPLTLIFALLPSTLYSLFKQRRFLGWTVSFLLCLLLGSGGTTPLPKMILGANAFNILTLDRFGFWASIIAIPFMAKFIYSFISGGARSFWISRFSSKNHFLLSGLTGISYFLFLIFIFHLSSFRPLQPKEIEIEPIVNFMNRDDHIRWRFLTLGFGDQMAWLSANSLAASVDGNYHSARRLPELTTRPVERLENAKFSGNYGLASLSDFLTEAEKYSLKYVFSNDRYYDPLLYYTGWSRTIRLENGIMVWERGNVSTIQPTPPKKLSRLLKYMWGIIPLSSLVIASLLTILYLKKYKEQDYLIPALKNQDYYPKLIIYSSSLLPVVFFSCFMIKQIYELLLVREQKDPVTAVLNYYNNLDFQRFENAFHFFEPSPTYPLDQYLLEKSVSDGGLLPSYAKLDSIHVKTIRTTKDSAFCSIFTRWNTSLGFESKTDSMNLVLRNSKWYIIPPKFKIQIPAEQMRSYNYVLFKKMGKRVISSFPTVKDDRIKKPFAQFIQTNLIRNGKENSITGEILNADDIPINISLKVLVRYQNELVKTFYPQTVFQYNLSPKSSTYFNITLDNTKAMDSLKVQSIELYAETDVSERGYIHGGAPSYTVKLLTSDKVQIETKIYDELTTSINIPAILIAEKDESGKIWQSQLLIHKTAIRSGLSATFQNNVQKIQHRAIALTQVPLSVFINGQKRSIPPILQDELATKNKGIVVLPHCFMSEEFYLQ
ncbi:hypothetical protein HDE68_000860 [Pedobacter cryoconitis]|uniref:Membrane protein 6-pyruvoyl-tetrahydropterin synthase-related domain-containing protein n=1 Tax=Pedobacter cryoconitis TaxID=188932 RepID=A0A7W9DYX4_9SPHI|nr:hypothetical protein [Pedobacter cryoconitis]MBB5634975.1 hypothetical protein [Pedobacter cryoconitis]